MKTGNTDHNDEDKTEPEVESGLSAVASAPAKNIAVMAGIAILLLGTIWYVFFSPTDEEKRKAASKPAVEVSNKIETSKPARAGIDTKITALPDLPSPPPLMMPTPPPPPALEAAPVKQTPVVKVVRAIDDSDKRLSARLKARLKTPIMVSNGEKSGGGAGAEESGLAKLFGGGNSSGRDSGNFTPTKTSAQQQQVTVVGDMGTLIAQGKIIDAILETAINTDLSGVLRAVISRDVYAEAGKAILIPKGSRLIGNYESSVKVGQKRVSIIWSRVIMPNGTDIAIDSPATDALGRSGMEGLVDNKFKELFASAILVSTISTGFAVAADNLAGGDSGTTTTASDGSTTSTSDATEIAIADAAQQIGATGASVTQQMINTQPTITVDQGSRIKVFVNRDLLFSNSLAQNVRFVQ